MNSKATKIRLVLFSTPMVQAILKGRKTQTRRTKGLEIVNNNLNEIIDLQLISDPDTTYALIKTKSKGTYKLKYPYEVGDILWVRETFREIEQEVGSPRFEYKATETINLRDKWKPSLFMPKDACRLFLRIKSIRAERLQDISWEDAIAEGIKKTWISDNPECCKYKNYLQNSEGSLFPKGSFMSLWASINSLESWNSNPFVWVYEFERIEKPLNFGV